MIRPTAVESREVCRIWLRYSDSTAGGKSTWLIWQDMAFSRTGMTARASETVHLAPAGGIAQGEEGELCPDALYMQLTSKAVTDVMPGAQLLVENVGGSECRTV